MWKTRNDLIFEGKAFTAIDLIDKIAEEADFWLLAQQHEKEMEEKETTMMGAENRKWIAPNRGWMKCNIGVDVDKKNQTGGASWVLRDERGRVSLHSRRAFSNIHTLDEAKFQALLWTIESLSFHRVNRVIIAIDDATLPNVILRPKAWPNFTCQYVEIMVRLRKLEWWRMVKEERSTNRGAFLIAQSVTRGGFVQSYVAAGAPGWKVDLFRNEEPLPSI